MSERESAATADILAWLHREGRLAQDAEALLAGLSQALLDHGVPLARATTHAPTLHPEFRWVMRVWCAGSETVELRRAHGIETTPTFHGNTVEHVVRTDRRLTCRLDGGDDLTFPVLEELRAQGYTHYVMAPLHLASGQGAASWATRQPGGFTPGEIRLLHGIVETFSLVFETKSLRQALGAMLAAYVGADPARHILAGTVQRGDVRTMRAAMMLTDLRGFGHLSDALGEGQVVDVLNEMFDRIVPAVSAQGGHILKFTGDGVLAVFPAEVSDERCRRAAYRAATDALAALAAPAACGRRFEVGIALHLGDVAYGNIGSGDRLDFTAIGRDVNILSRLERFCKTLRRPLLMTEDFVANTGLPVTGLGEFAFRGFRTRRAIFTATEPGAAAATT